MSLNSIYRQFIRKSYVFEERAEDVKRMITKLSNWEVRYLTCTLLSDIWQSWCNFCRSTIISSSVGTIDRSGFAIPAICSNCSEARIGYLAKCAIFGATTKPNKAIRARRQEPTWGDVDKLMKIIQTINPANTNNLLTGFGLPLKGVKHLQVVRNANAHLNSETMTAVRDLLFDYGLSQILYPADLAWEIDPNESTHCVYSWLGDLRTMADQATQ